MVMNFNGILFFCWDYWECDMLIKFLIVEYGKKMFFICGVCWCGFKMVVELLLFMMGEYVGDLCD